MDLYIIDLSIPQDTPLLPGLGSRLFIHPVLMWRMKIRPESIIHATGIYLHGGPGYVCVQEVLEAGHVVSHWRDDIGTE